MSFNPIVFQIKDAQHLDQSQNLNKKKKCLIIFSSIIICIKKYKKIIIKFIIN